MFKLLITDSRYQWFNALIIALSAAMLCEETFLIAGFYYEQWNVQLLVLGCTFFAYLRISFSNSIIVGLKKAIQFPIINVIVSLSLFALLQAVDDNLWPPMLICFVAIILTLLYFDLGLLANYINIRKIYFAKTFLLAFIWSLVTVSLPLAFAGSSIFNSFAIVVFARRFLFIAALSIPFDIRDSEKDKTIGYKNFVNLIGLKKSKILSLIFLAFFILTGVFQYQIQSISSQITLALIISVLIAAFLILVYDKNKINSTAVLFFIDGMLMVQFFLIVAAESFS